MKRWVGLIIAQSVIIFTALAYVALKYYDNKYLAKVFVITGIIMFVIGAIIHFKHDVKVPPKEGDYFHVKQPWEKTGKKDE